MGKRKSDCSIDDFIVDYLKKRKCVRTLKLFEEKNKNCENQNICQKFMNYLKRKESEKVIAIDDLGFEINFEAFRPVQKVSHRADYYKFYYKCIQYI